VVSDLPSILDPSLAVPAILGVGTALPPNVIDQEALAELLRSHWGEKYAGSRRWQATFDQIQRSVHVHRRYLARPVSDYLALDTFAKANAAWFEEAPKIGVTAAQNALESARMKPGDIDYLFFVTGTGIATPSVDARIVNLLGMRQNIRRTPIFGLGCAGGVAGVGRAADVLRAFPDKVAMVVSVELCSLTFQRTDASIANIIGSALFGDGGAAVVLGGAKIADRAAITAPRIIASRSIFYPETEPMMGWEVTDAGLKIRLSPSIPDLVRANLGGNVDAMLADHGLNRAAIKHWIAHPGGNRVLEALAQALELPAEALEASWRMLGATGNLSSASVLFVLHDLLERGASAGDLGVMLAMGPGFCAELALLQWV
jgi:alkylresorcinol/alkylpyrone synthase